MNKSQPIATITLAAAQKMAVAVEAKALEINVPVVFSVVDHGGNTLLIQRMDEAFVTSCDISLNKAGPPAACDRVLTKLPMRCNPVHRFMACSSPTNSALLFSAEGFQLY